MIWSQPFSLLELFLLIAFSLLYVGYLFRMKRLSNALKQKPHLVWLKLILRGTYFLLLIIALLGPSFGAAKKEIRSTGKDILLAVDLSASMNATDVQPTRLEKVKAELPKLMQQFNSDRTGLIIFSSEAFLQSPFTFDQSALQLYTQTLNTNLVPEAGTDLAAPLNLAVEKFRQQQGAAAGNAARILVVVSDGEDFGENLRQPLRDLEKENVQVFALGVGSAQGSPIPTAAGFKEDQQGNRALSKLNSEGLKAITRATGGQYFEVNDRSSEITKLISAINNVKGTVHQSRTIDIKANKYFYPLLAALLLMFIDAAIRFNTFRL